MASGAIVAYGDDTNLIHQPESSDARRLVLVDVDGRFDEYPGPVLQVGTNPSRRFGKRYQALGQYFRQPVLQLAPGDPGSVYTAMARRTS